MKELMKLKLTGKKELDKIVFQTFIITSLIIFIFYWIIRPFIINESLVVWSVEFFLVIIFYIILLYALFTGKRWVWSFGAAMYLVFLLLPIKQIYNQEYSIGAVLAVIQSVKLDNPAAISVFSVYLVINVIILAYIIFKIISLKYKKEWNLCLLLYITSASVIYITSDAYLSFMFGRLEGQVYLGVAVALLMFAGIFFSLKNVSLKKIKSHH